MNVVIWITIILILVFLGTFFEMRWGGEKDKIEHFVDSNGLEEKIVNVYKDVLAREPNAQELIGATRDIQGAKLTMDGLKQKLIDSEEYDRLIKLQSNTLTPELRKMLSDSTLLKRIGEIYFEERKKPIPSKMVLPLKDVYIWLEYNEYAFRAFLRSENYGYFEDDAIKAKSLDKTGVETLLAKLKINKDDITKKGVEIATKEQAKLAAASSTTTASSKGNPVGTTPNSTPMRTVQDQDSDMSSMVKCIVRNANQVFDKDQAARMLEQQHAELRLPVRQHYGDMVLRPEQSWNVPYRPPPVCTTLGQKPLIQPVMTNSPLLLGTSLEDSVETQNGSIMPKFEYKEYIPIKIENKPSSSNTSPTPSRK